MNAIGISREKKYLFKVKKNTKGNCLGRIRLDILKKYRCAAYVGKSLGVSRKKIRSVGSKRKCNTMKQRLQEVVTSFLEREDNCTTLPGKKKCKRIKTESGTFKLFAQSAREI